MYKLYGAKYARSLMCEMVMIDGEIPYELTEIDMLANELRTLAFLAVNPAGQIPVLITPEGDTLVQTAAINLYVSDKHKLHDYAPALDEAERGIFVSGLFYLVGELEPIVKRFLYPHRYALQPEDSKAVYAQALEIQSRSMLADTRSLKGESSLAFSSSRSKRSVGRKGALPSPKSLNPGLRRSVMCCS